MNVPHASVRAGSAKRSISHVAASIPEERTREAITTRVGIMLRLLEGVWLSLISYSHSLTRDDTDIRRVRWYPGTFRPSLDLSLSMLPRSHCGSRERCPLVGNLYGPGNLVDGATTTALYSSVLHDIYWAECHGDHLPSITQPLQVHEAPLLNPHIVMLTMLAQWNVANQCPRLQVVLFYKIKLDRSGRDCNPNARFSSVDITYALEALELVMCSLCVLTAFGEYVKLHRDGETASRISLTNCERFDSTKIPLDDLTNARASAPASRHHCFAVLGILFVAVVVLLVYGTVAVRQTSTFQNGSVMPQPADLVVTLPLAAGILLLRFSIKKLLEPLGVILMGPAIRIDSFRLNQFGHSIFELLYFSTVAITGFLVFNDEVWFPASLGGTGEAGRALTVVRQPLQTSMKRYYQVLIAYHTHNLIYVSVLRSRDQMTFELVIHDFVTLGLLVSSFLANFVGIGANVMILNDISDLFQYIYFITSDMDHKKLKAVTFLTLLSTWAYLRLYVYLREVLYYTLIAAAHKVQDVSLAFLVAVNAQLVMILTMQIYWFWLFAAKYRRVLFYEKLPRPQRRNQ